MEKKVFKILEFISLIIAITVVIVSLPSNNNTISTLLASYSFYLLIALLVIKSLYFIFKKLNYPQIFRILKIIVNNQRSIGLIVFNFAITHVIFQIIYFLNSMDFKYLAYGSGLLPISILLFLEFTSFKTGRNMIKNWKKKHSVIWIAIALILGHIYIVSSELSNYIIFIVFIYIIILIECLYIKKRGYIHAKLFTIGVFISILFISIVNFIS